MAPPIDYFTMVMGPVVEKLGVKFDIDIRRRGYYPKGPSSFRSIRIKRVIEKRGKGNLKSKPKYDHAFSRASYV